MNNVFSPRIGFIGAGRVGNTLGKYFAGKGQDISGYYSLSAVSAKEASQFTDTVCFNSIEELINDSNMIFITVPDAQIASVWNTMKQYNITGKIISHCSGAMSSSVFTGITSLGASGYSIHPLCAVSSKTESCKSFSDVFFTIEGSNDKLQLILDWLKSFGNPAARIDSSCKVKYHAAAVFASNLTAALYSTACSLLEECGLDNDNAHKALSGLFSGNCGNIINQGITDSLTGPIDRNDICTVNKHLEALSGAKRDIYRLLSNELLSIAAEKNPENDYSEMSRLLEGS